MSDASGAGFEPTDAALSGRRPAARRGLWLLAKRDSRRYDVIVQTTSRARPLPC